MDNYSKSVDNSIKPRLPPVDNYVNKPLNQSNFATVLIFLAICDMLDTWQIYYALTVA